MGFSFMAFTPNHWGQVLPIVNKHASEKIGTHVCHTAYRLHDDVVYDLLAHVLVCSVHPITLPIPSSVVFFSSPCIGNDPLDI